MKRRSFDASDGEVWLFDAEGRGVAMVAMLMGKRGRIGRAQSLAQQLETILEDWDDVICSEEPS